MSTMAENIVKALSDEGLLKHDFARRHAIEIVSDILGLEIEDITITDFGIPEDDDTEYSTRFNFHESISDLEHKPFKQWTDEDHQRFRDSFNWRAVKLVCNNPPNA